MDKLILLVGESGSGKSTVADILHNVYKLKQLQSYTTRKPRFEGEGGHIFIDLNQYNNMDKSSIVAYNFYHNNHYFATKQQVIESDIYIIDPKGIEDFKQHYNGEKEYIIIYLQVPEEEREKRMKIRNDDMQSIKERIQNDRQDFKNAAEMADIVISNANSEATAYFIYKEVFK